MRLLAGLDGMFRAGRDLFAEVLLFLLVFFCRGYCVGRSWAVLGVDKGIQRLGEPVPSQCAPDQAGDTDAMPELVWEGSHGSVRSDL
jgi:hypothetical protein